ncbi:hypothetical protein BD413DRAFT_467207 [Trametes elegans]|nr:hypothetical protein BD413DRAFT_467207 [Trametes elegans]
MVESVIYRRPQLPTELLREVIHHYACSVPSRESSEPRKSYKPMWNDYQPLTLTSRAMRQLALEAWFEVYYAQSPEDLLDVWPEMSLWTRELHCVELGTDTQILPVQWSLRAFRRLRKLRIDLDPRQSNAMLLMRFDHPRSVASNLQELEVHDISWPSPMVMRFISDAFPGLRVLKLSHDLIWCNLCNICRFATFKDHPPEEIVYDNFAGLPQHHAMFLMPLTQLHSVHFTIGYGLGGSTSISKSNNALWTGECDACMDIMYAGEGFQSDWVERKKVLERPPSLKRVHWRFRYKSVDDVTMDLEDEPEGAPAQADEDDEV